MLRERRLSPPSGRKKNCVCGSKVEEVVAGEASSTSPFLRQRVVNCNPLELIAIHERKPQYRVRKLKLLRTIRGQKSSLRLKIFKLQLAGMQRLDLASLDGRHLTHPLLRRGACRKQRRRETWLWLRREASAVVETARAPAVVNGHASIRQREELFYECTPLLELKKRWSFRNS